MPGKKLVIGDQSLVVTFTRFFPDKVKGMDTGRNKSKNSYLVPVFILTSQCVTIVWICSDGYFPLHSLYLFIYLFIFFFVGTFCEIVLFEENLLDYF